MNLTFNHGTPYATPNMGAMGRGMGALDPQSQQIAAIAATAVTTTGSILAALGVFGAAGGPIGAAIAGLAAIGVAIANAFSGCGETCVAASNIANQVGQILTDNLNHYVNSPVRYRSMQLAALNNYDIAWAALVKACGNQALLQAGQNCIADRQQGACKWRAAYAGAWQQDATGAWTWSGYGPAVTDGSGVCWNYFIGMRDPIANDPGVVPDPTPAQSLLTDIFGNPTNAGTGTGTSIGGTSISSLMPVLLIGGGTLAAVLLLGDN